MRGVSYLPCFLCWRHSLRYLPSTCFPLVFPPLCFLNVYWNTWSAACFSHCCVYLMGHLDSRPKSSWRHTSDYDIGSFERTLAGHIGSYLDYIYVSVKCATVFLLALSSNSWALTPNNLMITSWKDAESRTIFRPSMGSWVYIVYHARTLGSVFKVYPVYSSVT